MHSYVTLQALANGRRDLVIDRQEVRNAFDDALIEQLIEALGQVADDSQARVLVLRSEGRHFSAGADLNWMRRMAGNSEADNLADAKQLAELMHRLDQLPIPTIALVQGAAFGGAVGLAACCDMVIASREAQFCLSEVKIGLIPAVISPYVVRAISERQSRRYFLTAEAFSAERAEQLGLVHQVVDSDAQLAPAAEQFCALLANNSPQGIAESKRLIGDVSGHQIDTAVIELTAERIAKIRVSAEGQEGLSAFLEKRKPNWISRSNRHV